STLRVCQLGVAAENDALKILWQSVTNSRKIAVVSDQFHLAEIVVRQAFGIVPNLVAVQVFIAVIRMRHNRLMVLSECRLFPEIVGFDRPLSAKDRCSFRFYALRSQ